MSTALVLSTLSPVVCNSTTLPANEFEFSPAISREVFRHSGNKFGSIVVKPGAAPIITFQAPFKCIYDLMGFSLLKLTTFKFTFAKFTDAAKDATSVHAQYGLNTSAIAFARMVGISVNQKGLVMANVAVLPLSADGMTHPLLLNAAAAMPTVSSEPTLHTLGPVLINTVRVSGLRNFSLDLGNEFVGEPHDGDLYLRNVAEMEGNPMFSGEHADPTTFLSTSGLFGLTLTALVVNLRAIHATSGAALGTGASLSLAAGTLEPGPVRMRRNGVPSIGFSAQPVSATATHPVVVDTAATIAA